MCDVIDFFFFLQRDDITDPDDEFRGLAPKSLSKSCDKDGSCVDPENVWDYLPDVEVSSNTLNLQS